MMNATCVKETKGSHANRQSQAKTAKSTVSLSELWTRIVNSTKSSNQKMLSHASLIGFDRELNFAVLAVEPRYVSKFQNHTTHLSRIISHSLKHQQPIRSNYRGKAMIHILVGDDRHHIDKEINRYKRQIPQHLQALNYQRYSCDSLSEAIIDALSVSFGNCQKVVVIEDCNFREFGEPGLSLLQPVTKLPESTCLIFTASSIDRRLKVSKFLLDLGKMTEYKQIPPWRSDLLVKAVESEATEIGLKLTKDALKKQ